eukprot:GEZU01021414.1.p1 GENE.GEZU01021414.1~~GEZU01021414.1.p1  ORF type:complete len:212 (-),score=90.11 GEZU01021414.1:1785-2420(-)
MVYYFTCRDPSLLVYMGKDKYENEELIKYGWPEDIWFHVDDYSSAHVYVRLPKGKTIDDLSEEVIEDLAQLTKANSIQGNKVDDVKVIYTNWSNLKKTQGMDVGQVGFHNQKAVRTTIVRKRINEIVNRLNKTKVEKFPDLAAERRARDDAERAEKKSQLREEKAKMQKAIEEKKKKEELESFADLMKGAKMVSNQYGDNVDYRDIEEDFM